MKTKILNSLILGAILAASSLTARADVLGDIRASIAAASRQNTFAGYSVSTLRAYAVTKSGIIAAKTSHLGGWLSKTAAHQVFADLGWPLLVSSGKMELYQAQENGAPSKIIVMAYYDASDNASEIILMNDTLP